MNGLTAHIKTEDGSFPAYLVLPGEAASPGPAVIVLHEIFGITAFVRQACDRLADAGFIALAPDLFWRQEPGVELHENERERAMALMQGLDQSRAVEDAEHAAEYLRALPECNGKVAALGYCLGGKLAYLMAARSPIDAAISYYGVGIHGALGEAAALKAPLLLHVAEEDALCPPPAQQAIADALDNNPRVTILRHPAGHAFARTGSPAEVPDAANQANAASIDFLGRLR